jgi:hypothetical protein
MLKLTKLQQEVLKKITDGEYDGPHSISVKSLEDRSLIRKDGDEWALTNNGKWEARARGWLPRWEGDNKVKRDAIAEYLEEPERQLLDAVDDLGIDISREITNKLHGQDYTDDAMERTDKAFTILARWYSREAIRTLLCRISTLRRELNEIENH